MGGFGTMEKKILTIGIPTYKRPERVCKLLEKCIRDGALEFVDVIVVDDGLSDNLREKIFSISRRIKFYLHEENQGYAKTFSEIISFTETDYVMLSADDDEICVSDLIVLIKFLKKNRPDFVSTVFRLGDGRVLRGRADVENIKLGHVDHAGHHAPGLVYRCAKVIPHLEFLRERLKIGCDATHLFPQLVVIYLLSLSEAECYWHPSEPIRENIPLPPNIRDMSGDIYTTGASRWRRHRAFSNLFSAMESFNISDSANKAVCALKKLHDQEIFLHLKRSVIEEGSELVANWNGGAVFYSAKNPVRAILDCAKWIYSRIIAHRAVRRFEDQAKKC